jgi:hypothetical protein
MIKRKVLAISVLLIGNSLAVWAGGNDFYSFWTSLFSSFQDPNTGLTSFPTLQVPMGGMSEGMGTAYAAMARDSGYIESNPAASSLLKTSELSFYHHNWIADSNLEGVVYTVRFNDFGLGFGGKFLYVPFTAYNEWGVTGGKDYISETVGTVNVSYNLFSNYYYSGLAVGANFKVAYRNIPPIFGLNQSALAIMGDTGVMTSFNFLKFYNSQDKNFSVGIVVRNLGVSTLSNETLPQVATLGMAWSPLRPWTIAVDYNYPFSFPGQPAAETWNLAVGTTVSMTDFVSVQGGVLWKADNPRISLGTALALGTVSLTMNYNLDLSGGIDPVDKFSVEAKFDLGDSGRGAVAHDAEVLYLRGVEEYANGNYAAAIALWEEVLRLDPKYSPAAEDVRTAKQTMALQDQLQSIGAK